MQVKRQTLEKQMGIGAVETENNGNSGSGILGMGESCILM